MKKQDCTYEDYCANMDQQRDIIEERRDELLSIMDDGEMVDKA